ALGACRPAAVDEHAVVAGCEAGGRHGAHRHGHHHSPLKAGARFSPKAATPSPRSPVLATSIEASVSTAVPPLSPVALASISLATCTAAGPRAATRCA